MNKKLWIPAAVASVVLLIGGVWFNLSMWSGMALAMALLCIEPE